MQSTHRMREAMTYSGRLPRHRSEGRIEARPRRRGVGPDSGGGFDAIGLIQRAGAHDQLMWAYLCLTEHRRAAGRAEAAKHDIATIGNAAELAQFTGNTDRFARNDDVYRGVTGCQILADAAPAQPHTQWLSSDSVPYQSAQTATGKRDGVAHEHS